MTKDIIKLLKKKNVDDVLLIVGGSILNKDAENLKSEGVSEVFGINSDLKEIVKYIKKNVTY
jgi:methylmalonyl-CoA mutase cobalamin-binding domain/chain